jgi:aa3 type cytochrome c oxidase subunit IV
MADYKHGEMDITAQTATFDGFVSFTKKFVIALFVLAVFLAIFRT